MTTQSINIQSLQSIRVRLLPATNTKGERLIAQAGPASAKNRSSTEYDHGISFEQNIVRAARIFVEDFTEWKDAFFIAAEIPQSIHNPNCFLFVQISKDSISEASHAGIREIAAFETHHGVAY